MMNLILNPIKILTPKERKKAIVLFIVMTTSAFFDVAGVMSVIPFLAVTTNPEIVSENQFLAAVYTYLQFDSTIEFILFLGAGSFSLMTLTAAVRSFQLYLLNNFLQMARHNLSTRLLQKFLYGKYDEKTQRHSGDYAKNMLSEVDMFADRVLLPAANVASYSLLLLTLTIVIFVIEPYLAVSLLLVFFTLYTSVFLTIRGYVLQRGRERIELNQEKFETATEALRGHKLIKIHGLEEYYIKRFEEPSYGAAKRTAVNNFLSAVPRNIAELVALGGIILIVITILVLIPERQDEIIPLLAIYAFSGYRMLPSIQNVYQGITTLRFTESVVRAISADLGRDISSSCDQSEKVVDELKEGEPNFENGISLRNVSYKYPGEAARGFERLNLNITQGDKIGIIGPTGSGKSTFVDVLLGLLPANGGAIECGEFQLVEHNAARWRRKISYVPQDQYLFSGTIRENIAWGTPRESICERRVRQAASIASINDFIENELSDGYDTELGENGIRLSGGQRQRIGIARAVYRNPEILILDEATSALDAEVEGRVMDAIYEHFKNITVIIIAHRMSTLRMCNRMLKFEAGM